MTTPNAIPHESCVACSSSGLPIVFLYHSAVAQDADFGPSGQGGIESPFSKPALLEHADSVKWIGLPKLDHARYVLRSLRPGTFLHLYHENPSEALKAAAAQRNKGKAAKDTDPEEAHWETLRVLPGGALVPREHPLFIFPKPFSCSRGDGTHILTVLSYRLASAHTAKGLWVAVSANLWDRQLRRVNKPLMRRIDVPSVLGGTLEHMMQPDPGLFDKYVADFALPNFEHGRREPTSPLAQVKGMSEAFCKRLKQLSSGHPMTNGKAVIVPLPDPVGTAEALRDISLARHQQGLEYTRSKRHPLGAIAGIEFIRKNVYEEQADIQPGSALRLKPEDFKSTAGRPLFSDKTLREKKPADSELQGWVRCQETTYNGMIDGVRVHRTLPPSARFLPYDGQVPYGMVIAPVDDMNRIRRKQATRKMDRLYDQKQVAAFLDSYDKQLQWFKVKVSEHDEDRAKLIRWGPLKAAFHHHFDWSAPNTPGSDHVPGIVFMDEASRVLVAGGDSITLGLEPAIRTLLDVDKLQTEDGWALRAMVANQQGLFAPLQTFFAQQFDWYTNADNKLDKSYDTLKGLLCDEAAGGRIKGKLGWISPAGVGLSFGIHGFMAGAASHFVSRSFADVAARARQAAAQAVGKAAASAGKAAQSAEAAAAKTSELFATAEARFAAKINAWAHQQALMLHAVLNRQPPPRPVRARVEMGVPQVLDLLEALTQKGVHFNRSTTQQLKLWQRMPHDALAGTVTMDLLTTDVALRDARTLEGLAGFTSDARVAPLSDKAHLHYPKLAGVPDTMALSTQALEELFQQAHRYDRMKEWAVLFVGVGMPSTANAIASIAASSGTAAADATAAAARTAPKVGKAMGSMAKGAASLPAQMSIFGAFLQWRLLNQNKEKLEQLSQRLASTPGLTDDERAALQDAVALLNYGVTDNQAGVLGGVMEATAVAMERVRVLRMASGLLSVGAAFSGAVGNFMNAAQNFYKAMGKRAEGEGLFAGAYLGVSFSYAAGSLMLSGSGVEILHTLIVHRSLLEGSLRGATASVRAAEAAAGRFLARRLLFLSLTGWGLVLTVLSFGVEGLVVYFDRTPLEKWVENCYFGGDPQYRDAGSRLDRPEKWDQEARALEDALKKLAGDTVANLSDDEFKQRFPRLEARASGT